MAWPEKSGKNSWRVRYERDDGTLDSMSGFTSEEAANEMVARLNREATMRGYIPTASSQPFGGWIEPWFGSIDVAASTRRWVGSGSARSPRLPKPRVISA